MPWFFILFLLSSRFYNESEARHVKELPSSVVVGTVYCDTCFQQDFSKSSHFISGASVAVECNDGSLGPNFQQEVKTNEHGEFRVHLPYSIGKHVSKIKTCSVKLLRSSEPYCSVASKAISSSLHLKSRKEGTHIFSAGFFSFKPLKQPILCNQKPSIQNSVPFHAKKTSLPKLPENPSFPPPLKDPTTPEFPTLPDLPLIPLPRLPPLPQLPPLPPLPGLPNMPSFPGTPLQTKPTNGEPPRTKKLSNNDDKVVKPRAFFPTPPLFPPNPFQPPPLIPNPFQPPPLFPPLLPPNPLQPPPSPLIPFLPIPGLTPSPPPPSLPFLPFPPLPKFPPSPGIPPASSTPQKSSP